MSKVEYDAGVITMLKIIVDDGLSKKDIESLLYDRIETFKDKYGIEVFDQLEGFIDDA